MSIKMFSCAGGFLILPDRHTVLVSRQNGGNLIVNPPRAVWERSVLTREELMYFSFLVAAAGKAMIDALPQLEGGCINYWEAGNWALNEAAEPKGPKTAREHRRMHLHLLGRSRTSTDPAWQWGESPKFPMFADRHAYASSYERLSAEECSRIVPELERLLKTVYKLAESEIQPWSLCVRCGYPNDEQRSECEECLGRHSS